MDVNKDSQNNKNLIFLSAKIEEQMSKLGEEFTRLSKDINEKISQYIPAIIKSFELLPDFINKVQRYLIKEGWYINFMPFLPRDFQVFSGWIYNEEHNKIEEFFHHKILNRYEDIKKNVENRFPDRIKIINKAFEAHERKEYALSIPVMFSQADGIVHDILNTEFLNLQKVEKKLIKKFKGKLENNDKTKNCENFKEYLSYQLIQQLCFDGVFLHHFSQTSGREDRQKLFNRHLILHGRIINYDIESNSVRAISLLDFLSIVKDTFE